jgi:AcrR family transcriptional regulator
MDSHAVSPGRARHRSSPETYARILLAARNEFSARGLLGANMEALAKEVGVAKQVIYYHFGSREGLYEAVLQDVNEYCLSELLKLDLSGKSPVEAVIAFFSRMFDFYNDIPGLARLVLDFSFHGSVHFRVRDMQRKVVCRYDQLVNQAIAKGEAPDDLDTHAVLVFSVAIINDSHLNPDRGWGFEARPDSEIYEKRRRSVLRAIRAMLTFREA